MKQFFASILFAVLAVSVSAQTYQLHVEQHATNLVPGTTTYRLYIKTLSSSDFLSSIYGNSNAPFLLNTSTGSFYNDNFATGATAGGINPLFFSLFPTLAADSWVTIGIANSPVAGSGQSDVTKLESAAQPWLAKFTAGTPVAGSNVAINDGLGGAWFVLNGTANGYPSAGSNNKVLVMQITTTGTVNGRINAQVFPLGVGANQQQYSFEFNGVGIYNPMGSGVPGCTNPEACNYNASATEDNGSCIVPTGCDTCSGGALVDGDADNDGVCNANEVVGCQMPGACNFNPLATDAGTCDFFSCLGCTDVNACNFNPSAIYNNGTCNYTTCAGCTNPAACNYSPTATINSGGCILPTGCDTCAAGSLVDGDADNDGVCNANEVAGCLIPTACNYNPAATDNGGGCEFTSCVGCTNPAACNFDAAATIANNASCVFAGTVTDCNGECLNDTDGDGVCNELEVAGCTDALAPNFDPEATDDDGSCAAYGGGCVNPLACNFDPTATVDNGTCEFLSCQGCGDPTACNYDATAQYANSQLCTYAAAGYGCNGACLADSDADGVCNANEVLGCTDTEAQNFNPAATDNNGTCTYPGVCNDEDACNYVPWEAYCVQIEAVAVHTGMVGSTNLAGMTTYRMYALCEHPTDKVSGVVGDSSMPLAIHSTAPFYQNPAGSSLAWDINPGFLAFVPELNYDSWVTVGIGSLAEWGTSIPMAVAGPGVLDWRIPFEQGGSIQINDNVGGGWILVGGNSGAAGEDLRVLLGQFTTAGNITGTVNIQFFPEGVSLNGFTKTIDLRDACGLPQAVGCTFPEFALDCAGDCLSDADGDGVCAEFEVPGCTDVSACNFNASATDANGSCSYAQSGYTCAGVCLVDTDGDGVCNAFEVPGCTNPYAENFNSAATDDDGSCVNIVDPCAEDDVPPYFTFVPADTTVTCDQEMPTAMAVALDACGPVTVTYFDGPIQYILPCAPYQYFCPREFTAVDASGNTATAIQYITVVDTIAPVFIAPPPALVQVHVGNGETLPVPGVFVVDDCDLAATWSHADAVVSVVGLTSVIHRTYTATDACGNTATYLQVIQYFDAVFGCTSATACNFNSAATADNGSCTYAAAGYTCSGACVADADGDGVCDGEEVTGCTDPAACNFMETATEADGSCDFCSCADGSPVYGLDIEVVAEHTTGPLAGMTTYRYYITTEAENDFVSAISGNTDHPLELNTTAPFFQSPFGSALGQTINPALFGFAPELAYDSWVTIGVAQAPDAAAGEQGVNTVTGPANWPTAFEAGNGFVLNDDIGGAWFVLNVAANGVAGEDHRVLVAQLTTAGTVSGVLNAQIFGAGDGDNDLRYAFTFAGTSWTNGGGEGNTCGCTDSAATNYDPEADYDNGSCIYPVLGCIDATACNFDPAADEDNGSCVYAAEYVDCDGNCLEDSDSDGVCDALEVPGCTDPMAINYEEAATDDDGSCIVCALELSLIQMVSASCFDAEDGELIVEAVGAQGAGEVQYILDPVGVTGTVGAFGGLAAGAYTVSAVDGAGCAATLFAEVGAPAELLITVDAVTDQTQNETNGAIAITVLGGTAPYQFAWTDASGTPVATTEDLSGVLAGTYTLTVTDAHGCTAAGFPVVVGLILGMSEVDEGGIAVFPNPAHNWLRIELPPGALVSSLSIIELTGRSVYSNENMNVDVAVVEVSSWAAGVYLVRVQSAQGEEWSARFVKER
jgi:hypothetical protein